MSTDELLKLYRTMLLIRRFEERAGQLYGMGLIGGFCHLYIGQEAVVVGMQAALVKGDTVVTSYRDHGHMLACDMDPRGVMAELTGRSGRLFEGQRAARCTCSAARRISSAATASLAPRCRSARALRSRTSTPAGRWSRLTYLGDGAVNQGQVAESLNMAALWKLPVIIVIENNRYGMGTAVRRAAAGGELYKRGEPYGIPGMQVDGMDVVAVKQAALMAAEHARTGRGPTSSR